jgi:hypothetical protein
VEDLVGYAERDLVVPERPNVNDLSGANRAAAVWCDEVNASEHS